MSKMEFPAARPAIPIADQIKDQLHYLDLTTQTQYDHLTTLFLAIEKTAESDPHLAVALAKVGSYVAEALTGELDTLGIRMNRTFQEIH